MPVIRGTLLWLGMRLILLSLVGTGREGGVVIWNKGEKVHVTRFTPRGD